MASHASAEPAALPRASDAAPSRLSEASEQTSLHLRLLVSTLTQLRARVVIADTVHAAATAPVITSVASNADAVRVTTHASIEEAYGSVLAVTNAREMVHDRVAQLLASGKASKKLAATLSKWQAVRTSAAAADEALMFADQWLAREAPFEPLVASVAAVQDALFKKSLWITAADGWADAATADLPAIHNVLASAEDINVIVFTTDPKPVPGMAPPLRRDVGLYACNYGGVYVASCCPAASPEAAAHFVTAVREAESFNGPAVIQVYIPAAGATGAPSTVSTSAAVTEPVAVAAPAAPSAATPSVAAAVAAPSAAAATDAVEFPVLAAAGAAVDSGAWPLYRYDPRAESAGETAFKVDRLSLIHI